LLKATFKQAIEVVDEAHGESLSSFDVFEPASLSKELRLSPCASLQLLSEAYLVAKAIFLSLHSIKSLRSNQNHLIRIILTICIKKIKMAPWRGLEPPTLRLTAGCSAIELPWNAKK
jgi:hypothetical protein